MNELGKAEMIGGPYDGVFEKKLICDKCGHGEVLDLYVAVPGDYVNERHRYVYHECDDTFMYRGKMTIDPDNPEWSGI